MSVDPNAGSGGPGVNVYIEAGKAIARWANRALGTGESKREAAQYDAAQRVGYTTRPGRFPVTYDPQGNITTPDKAREAGRAVIVASGRTSKEQAEADRAERERQEQADKEYRRARREEEAETRQREREARKERERKRATSIPDRGRAPGRLGRIVDTATAILVGTGAADILRDVFEAPQPEPKPPPAPPQPPVYFPPGAEGLPRGPFVPRSPPSSPPPVMEPPAPAPKPPKAEPPAPWEPLLLPVPIYSSPVPVPGPAPAPPGPATAMPGGAPVPSGSTPLPAPAYQQALPWLLGAGLSLLAPGSGSRRRRDPLTVNQPDALGSLSLASFPLPFPGSGFGGYGAGTPSQPCECKQPSAKRRRKSKRTVCYSGTYVERASGLRKTKRRKVKCQ